MTDDNIVDFTGTTTQPIPVEKVCNAAKDLEYVLIIGYDDEGKWTVRSSDGDIGTAFISLEIARSELLSALNPQWGE